jgi:hypothetical protein
MRPFGVTLAGIYQILRCLTGLVFAGFILLFVGPANKFHLVSSHGNLPERIVGHFGAAAAGLAIILFAVIHIFAGYGVLRMHNWGRQLAIILSAIELAMMLPGVAGGNPFRLVFGALNAACIFYLAMPSIRRTFLAAGR